MSCCSSIHSCLSHAIAPLCVPQKEVAWVNAYHQQVRANVCCVRVVRGCVCWAALRSSAAKMLPPARPLLAAPACPLASLCTCWPELPFDKCARRCGGRCPPGWRPLAWFLIV